MRGQMNFFIKAILIVISVLAFTSIILISQMSKITTVEEKGSSELRMDALEILQKLVNTKECLAYEYKNVTQKGNLDLKKINYFVNNYQNVEPRCAKAINFDYNIQIVQFEKKFSVYPGMEIDDNECNVEGKTLGIATHNGEEVYYFKCNGTLTEDCCSLDIDQVYPLILTCGGVKVVCRAYDCIKFTKTKEECKFFTINPPLKPACCIEFNCYTPSHPNLMKCYNIDPENNCTELNTPYPTNDFGWTGPNGIFDTNCGFVATSTYKLTGNITKINITEKEWGFGILSKSLNVTSGSPFEAKKEEITISLPVTIYHNKTFSREGIIYLRAVRGELETLNSLIEDTCLKAEKNPTKKIVVSRDMYFTYPVNYNGTHLDMFGSYKLTDCNYPINFENITRKGKYFVEIIYNPTTSTIDIKT